MAMQMLLWCQGFGDVLLVTVIEAYTASAGDPVSLASKAAMAMHIALKQLADRPDAVELLCMGVSLLVLCL